MPKSRSWARGLTVVLAAEDARLTRLVGAALEKAGLTVRRTGAAGAIAALDREPIAAVLAAHALGPLSLASLVARGRRSNPEVPVLVLGSTSTVDEAVDVMRRGAADYLPPPLEPEVLLLRLERVVERRVAAAPDAPASKGPELLGLVGASQAMQRLYSAVEKVTRYKTNVLLLGESGTGKELIARALHARGPRRRSLFVPLNCATLGRDLLENELFGHERGAFTGANERKKGLFELADGGTLFLDEIAEMDPSTQAKLLRVLERNEFRRVGGTDKVKVDLSVIAATHRNLPGLIAADKFREDLYYRLKVVTLVVPPLRERREDIPALIDAFIADFNRRNNGKIFGISPRLLKRFMEHDWPGNVRELKNAVESAAILAVDQTLDADPLEAQGAAPPSVARVAPAPEPTSAGDARDIRIPETATLAEAERRVILAQLARCGSKRDTARALGIGVRTLYTRLKEYGVE